MALNLADAERMIEAAEKNGVSLLCGHTQGFTAQLLWEQRVWRWMMKGRGEALPVIWEVPDALWEQIHTVIVET